MKKSEIKLGWSEVKRRKPNYTKFSQVLHADIKTISNSISYIRFLLNAISEIVKTDRGKKLTPNYAVLSMMRRSFFYQAIIEIHKIFNEEDVLSQ
jgi:hypothetical protein